MTDLVRGEPVGRHLESVEVDDRVWITNDIAGGWTQIRGRVVEVMDSGLVRVDISPYICGGGDKGTFPLLYLFATNADARPHGYDLRSPEDEEKWVKTQEEWWARDEVH